MTTKSSVSVVSVVVVFAAALVAGIGILPSALRHPAEQANHGSGPEKAPGYGPGVVRVSVVEGSVVVQRGGSNVQTSAVPNAPMLPGDYISTGKMSRAELQFDGYTAVRLGGNVQGRIVSNDPNNRKMQLASGTVEIGILHDGHAIQIDTPSVTARAPQAGDFRISIADDGATWITARRGSVEVVTPQRTYSLGTGTTLIAAGAPSHPSIAYNPEVAFDSLDDFSAERDKTMIAALNASPNLNLVIAGYDDLSAYGQWQAIAGYGESWVPNEPAGWVPYRNGSWSWEGGYGWTWVGSEPWGWTPYHYGNWYYCSCGSSGWAWLPPAVASTPTWAPALVGFFGFDAASAGGNPCEGNYAPASYSAPTAPYGNNVAAAPFSPSTPAPYGVGGPSGSPESPYGYGSGPPAAYPYPYTGWVPIAPNEPFYPWYPGWAWFGFGWGVPFFGGFGYRAAFATNIVNVTNITNVTRIYSNFRHGGATAITTRNFRHGTITGHTMAVNTRDLGRRFGSIHGALPIAPTRNNLTFAHGTVHAPVTFSKAFDSPRFASDRALAPTSFAKQQKAVAQATHGGLTGRATAHAALGRSNAPVSRANVPATHTNVAVAHANLPEARANAFPTRENPSVRRDNAPVTRENAPAVSARGAQTMRESASTIREHSAMPENGEVRERSDAPRQLETGRNDFAPPGSWDRFNQARSVTRPAEFPAGSGGGTSARNTQGGEVSAPSEAGREGALSDSWGRFSAARGESYEGSRESYGNTRDPYADRQSTPSYAHGMPSYSRGAYSSPYSRESTPWDSRGSYPSYSRGSYPSYSRGSYPSYSRGSYGLGPSYSRGYSVPARPSGGGGGGEHYGSGGRPPQ